ncbi:DUF167 domain-containing protein [Leptothrix ochracea]|uniref:DUF167 domain-containing protein n=1 Tax=Leptothrix ochracea TaxID=735331 RepID=UPI0034E2B19F
MALPHGRQTLSRQRRPSEPSTAASGTAAWPPFVRWRSTELCVIDVVVVPNARRTEAVGLHGEALRIKLAALPIDGAANETLIRWLAEVLDVPRARVALLHGTSSRRKQLSLDVAQERLRQWLISLKLDDSAQG